MESMIRDIKLAPSGHDKIAWVKNFMPVMRAVDEEFSKTKPFAGIRMVITLHLEAKTAYMAEVFAHAGAEVAITGSNPLSTQDDVAAALVEDGIKVFAWHGCTEEEYFTFINRALDTKPMLLIDDGGDLVHTLHTSRRELLPGVYGGSEETTTTTSPTASTPAADGPRAGRAKRRTFTTEYKRRIVAEYDAAPNGTKGAVLRRERLYDSHVQEWRAAITAGTLDDPPRRGRPAKTAASSSASSGSTNTPTRIT